MEEAAAIGLDIRTMKSAAFSLEGEPSYFADGMPGVWGELDFIDVLGVPVEKAEAVTAEMLKKIGLGWLGTWGLPWLSSGEEARREGVKRLALMDTAWEDAIEETDYATEDGLGGMWGNAV
ncbi:hypothetical protein CYMTET_43641 [Cymbomonas tetramitiformis]|uniref:Uncharacterized protein n=1 Tax=Cymbomonas tetramitiformis TaxID=36881 RepID=A0AAE0C1S9_9CHLO|nr:hypothetical protein CYMTET_43641 [Cymbomonas tetramitiformis]